MPPRVLTAEKIDRILKEMGGDLEAAARILDLPIEELRDIIHEEPILVHWPRLIDKVEAEKERIKAEGEVVSQVAAEPGDATKQQIRVIEKRLTKDASDGIEELIFRVGAKTSEDRAEVQGWMVSSRVESVVNAAMTRGVNTQGLLHIVREQKAVGARLAAMNAKHARNRLALESGVPPEQLPAADKVDLVEEDMLRRWYSRYFDDIAVITKATERAILLNIKVQTAMKSREKKNRPEMVLSGSSSTEEKPAAPGEYPGPPEGHTIPEGAVP